jgi:hypothetical protein
MPKSVAVPTERAPGQEWLNAPLVWAISEERQATYLFPRECPRIIFWRTPTTTPEDAERWWGNPTVSMIANVELDWRERIESQAICRYELPTETFQALADEWMWVSKATVEPIGKEVITNLLEALRLQDVEVRFMERLTPLRDVWNTSVHASGIRLRNAQDWPDS